METKTTTVRGLAFDVVVTETMHEDVGGHLFYKAEIVLMSKRNGARKLVRKTRIPGAAHELVAAVQQQGIRALEAFSIA